MMRVKQLMSFLVMLALIGVVAKVEADDSKPNTALLYSTSMPTTQLESQPLEQVLSLLKEKVPGFHFVLYRAASVPRDYPVLPAMRLQDVSVEQFIQLINNEYPDVKITEINNFDPSYPPLCQVDIKGLPAAAPAATQPDVVRVFELGQIIAHRAAAMDGGIKLEDRERSASNDVLSMVQAALDVAGESTVPVMKIHAPTNTLIFKGSATQAAIVSNAMGVLTNSESYHFNDQMNAKEEEIRQLREEVRITRNKYYELKASTQPVTSPAPAK